MSTIMPARPNRQARSALGALSRPFVFLTEDLRMWAPSPCKSGRQATAVPCL